MSELQTKQEVLDELEGKIRSTIKKLSSWQELGQQLSEARQVFGKDDRGFGDWLKSRKPPLGVSPRNLSRYRAAYDELASTTHESQITDYNVLATLNTLDPTVKREVYTVLEGTAKPLGRTAILQLIRETKEKLGIEPENKALVIHKGNKKYAAEQVAKYINDVPEKVKALVNEVINDEGKRLGRKYLEEAKADVDRSYAKYKQLEEKQDAIRAKFKQICDENTLKRLVAAFHTDREVSLQQRDFAFNTFKKLLDDVREFFAI